MDVIDNRLLERFLSARRVFWAGAHPPLATCVASAEIYDAARDFRVPPACHQAFDLSYLVEQDLAAFKQWPLVLDEALRTLVPGGTLVLRHSQNQLLTVFGLAHFLHTWSQGRLRLEFQHQHVRGGALTAVTLSTDEVRQATLESITFGAITDGSQPESVEAFVASVNGVDGIDETSSEILICGPAGIQDHLPASRIPLRLIPQPDAFADRGWITRKKNLIVAHARGENLVIVHDRYRVPPDFLQEFARFGGDYAVIVCRQETASGQRVPDWVTVGTDWNWSPPGLLEYGDYHPHMYVNGGAMVAKRWVLEAHPWNELLFWNQAEDVELTRRLVHAGIQPRLARRLTLKTKDRPRYLSSFEAIPWLDHCYVLPSDAGAGRVASVPYDGGIVTLGGPDPVFAAAKAGVVFGRGWTWADGRATWPGAGEPEIGLRLSATSAAGYRLVCATARRLDGKAEVDSIRVNDVPATIEDTSPPSEIRAVVPPDAVQHHNNHLRIRFTMRDGSTLAISSFALRPLLEGAGPAPDRAAGR